MARTSLLVADLGPYRLLEVLGAGAMGTVYLAEDREEHRRVALKVLHPHLLLRTGFFQRFEREAQAGERVCHPNVVRTLDCGIQAVDGTPYCLLVMEYVEGRTLREILQEWGRLPEAMIREIALQVTAGLEAIHAAGIVHRDLKPENVLVTRDHQARIMDLGVARMTDVAPGVTREGQFAGSLCYAAPEQFESCSVGPSSDLYALGVVLYELATGGNPFWFRNASSVVHAHRELVPPRLSGLTPPHSAFLASVVATLLEKTPKRRFASSTELRNVLEVGEGGDWWAEVQRRRRRTRARRPRVPVRRDTVLVGRAESLGQLRAAWQQACGGEGSALLIEGEAGIGKSRLVDAFLDEVVEDEAEFLYGSYAPTGGRGALANALLARFGSGGLEDAIRPRLAGLPSLVTALASAVRDEKPPAGTSPLEGDALHTAFTRLVQGMASERPLLWIVEDLHFASAGARALLLSLVRALEGHRVLLVLTTRPGLPPSEVAELSRLRQARPLVLPRLGVREVVALLEDALGSVALAERLGVTIAGRTDGVPFFVLETLRSLKEAGALAQRPDGTYFEAMEIGAPEVPRAVRDLIEERLEQLSGDERAIIEMGAVAGYTFDPVLAARALGQPRLRVLQTLACLERRTGIVRSDEHVFRFDHHQIQEIVCSRLPSERQEHHHTRIADAVAAQAAGRPTGEDRHALATHLLHGRCPEEARPYLLPALDHLSRTLRNEAAVELAEAAVRVPGVLVGGPRVEVLLRLAERLDLLGSRARQKEVVGEAAALVGEAGDFALETRTLVAKGRLHLAADEYELARDACRRALASARRAGDQVGRMQAATTLGRAFSGLGAFEREKRLYEAVRSHARATGNGDAEAASTINIGTVWMALGRYDEADRCFEDGLALAERCGNRVWQANATANLQEARLMQGDGEGASERIQRYLELVRELGDRHGEAQGLLQLGRVYSSRGELDEAEASFERGLVLFREIGSRTGRADSLWMLGCLSRRRGEYESARLHLQGSLALAREIRNPLAECKAAGELGRTLADEGRLEAAIALLDRQLELARTIEIVEGEALASASLADCLLAIGRVADAEDRADRVCEIAERIQQISMRALAEGVRGRVARNRGLLEDAAACFARQLELANLLGDPQLEAEAHLAVGTLAVQRGDRGFALAELAEAAATATRIGLWAVEVCAKVTRAQLNEGCREPARAALLTKDESLPVLARLEANYVFWKAVQDPTYLKSAKDLLEALVAYAPEADRETMIHDVPLYREVRDAWETWRRQPPSNT